GLAGRFMFKGFVGDSDLPALYRSCDCFAQPSKFETQGLSVLEAMACGKPAIVVKGFATEECIEQGKNGFALAEDPKLWAKAIMSCAKGKKKMAKSARATACAHSLEKAASEMIAIYRSAQKIHKLKAK
ncbi:MAG TPA: glycosyltransferase, partial [Candidatus Micrarchaeota archaeon]|nr:glycosyltransferase [Candidatus Micrarchaeota archaeon]